MAERSVLTNLPLYADLIVTAFLILAVIVAVAVCSVLVSLELYAESVHMVGNAGKVVAAAADSSAFKQLNSSFWDPSYQVRLRFGIFWCMLNY